MEGKWKLLPFRLVPWEKEKNTIEIESLESPVEIQKNKKDLKNVSKCSGLPKYMAKYQYYF